MEWYRIAFGEVYPLVYAHRDDAEAERAAAAFAPLFAREGRVLDVACGAGRHTVAFGRWGVRTVGVDLSEVLLDEAVEQRHLGGRVVCGDMRCLPFRDASVSGAINMFTSFGYFDDESDNARAVAEIARVLCPGGRFLLDFLNAARMEDIQTGTTRREEHGAVIEETRERSADGRWVSKRVRVTRPDGSDVAYVERVRLYTLEELAGLLAAAGLRVIRRCGDYDGGAFDAPASPRLILLSEKGLHA